MRRDPTSPTTLWRIVKRPLLVLLPFAVALAGCGGSTSSATNFSGDEQGVAEQVEALQSAAESRDGAAVCGDVLTADLRESMRSDGASCADQVDEAIGDADDFELEVQDVSVQGEQATARVLARYDGADRVRTVELVRERGSWRISSLG
jgi:hypothetical protein